MVCACIILFTGRIKWIVKTNDDISLNLANNYMVY